MLLLKVRKCTTMSHVPPAPCQRMSSSRPSSQRGQRWCGLGSQPWEARAQALLLALAGIARHPKKHFGLLLNSWLNLYLASLFCIVTRKTTCLRENKFPFSSYPWGNKIYDTPHYKSCLT